MIIVVEDIRDVIDKRIKREENEENEGKGIGVGLLGNLGVIEDYSNASSPYHTYLSLNPVFKQYLLLWTPRLSQKIDNTEFIMKAAQWMRVPPHPCIPTIYWVEMKGDRPVVATEYSASLTLVGTNFDLTQT